MGYIMKQLEIDFFFPLTQQIPLDLDFTPCEQYELQKRKEASVTSITSSLLAYNGDFILTSSAINNASFVIQPTNDYVGHWSVTDGFEVRRSEKPNWVVRKLSELLLGWKWKDK
jgi:hypothetical protein